MGNTWRWIKHGDSFARDLILWWFAIEAMAHWVGWFTMIDIAIIEDGDDPWLSVCLPEGNVFFIRFLRWVVYSKPAEAKFTKPRQTLDFFKYPLVIQTWRAGKGTTFQWCSYMYIYIYIYIHIRIIKTSINRGFSIDMFDYKRVHHGNVNSTKVLSFCSWGHSILYPTGRHSHWQTQNEEYVHIM